MVLEEQVNRARADGETKMSSTKRQCILIEHCFNNPWAGWRASDFSERLLGGGGTVTEVSALPQEVNGDLHTTHNRPIASHLGSSSAR